MSSRPTAPIRRGTPIWMGALLWLWCAALGGSPPRPTSERFVGATADVGVRAAIAPPKVAGVERVANPKPRERSTPTSDADAAMVEPFAISDATRLSSARARDIAPRPRRLTLAYDATAPPTLL